VTKDGDSYLTDSFARCIAKGELLLLSPSEKNMRPTVSPIVFLLLSGCSVMSLQYPNHASALALSLPQGLQMTDYAEQGPHCERVTVGMK